MTDTIQLALDMIRGERQRQQQAEGFDDRHDDHHAAGELATAAACYLVHDTGREVLSHDEQRNGRDAWPWEPSWDKRAKHGRLRRLVIAGALVAAEIERELRGMARREGMGS